MPHKSTKLEIFILVLIAMTSITFGTFALFMICKYSLILILWTLKYIGLTK